MERWKEVAVISSLGSMAAHWLSHTEDHTCAKLYTDTQMEVFFEHQFFSPAVSVALLGSICNHSGIIKYQTINETQKIIIEKKASTKQLSHNC